MQWHLVCGTSSVLLKTRHGRVRVKRVRLCEGSGREVTFALWQQEVSWALQEQLLYWVTRLPFAEVVHLLQQRTGVKVLSEQSVWRLVQHKAHELDEQQRLLIPKAVPQPVGEPVALDVKVPTFEELHQAQAPEWVVMSDGIGVKAQKPARRKRGARPETQKDSGKEVKRHETDVMILPRRDGTYHTVCEGVSGAWTLVEASRAWVGQEWGEARLPVVAISDSGAGAWRSVWIKWWGGAGREKA